MRKSPVVLFLFVPLLLVGVLLLSPAPSLAEDKPGRSKPKKKVPIPGIHWEGDFDAGMAKAAREGRPILLAVNALESESANNHLGTVAYRSKAWGDASRGYVAFVCNPNQHGSGAAGTCGRYPGCSCGAHMKALRWFLGKFGQELISPQHVILEPDGDVAYRKEYYTGVVGPLLLDTYLSHVSPKAAYGQAAVRREAKIKELGAVPAEEFDAAARSWLDGKDGLAAAGMLNILDDSYDASKRHAVIRALRHAPKLHAPVLALAAEERVLYPSDDLEEAMLWLPTLYEVDRTYGVWAATRMLVRIEDRAKRDAILRIWAGKEGDVRIAQLPKDEQAAAYEALLLAGDKRALGGEPDAYVRGRGAEIVRAKRMRNVKLFDPGGALAAALKKWSPRTLYARISHAGLAQIKTNEDGLVKVLAKAPWFRVRVAAALRLLEAQRPQGGAVAALLVEAADDPIEGPEARTGITRILGEDPGQNPQELKRLLVEHLHGGAK